jgi:hypothetical protein
MTTPSSRASSEHALVDDGAAEGWTRATSISVDFGTAAAVLGKSH